MILKIAVLFAVVVSLSWAEDHSEKSAPVIPADLQAEVAWTQLDAQNADLVAKKAAEAAQAVLVKAQAICGKEFSVQRVGTKVVCVKVEKPAAEEKK